jgi:hypothetical protein
MRIWDRPWRSTAYLGSHLIVVMAGCTSSTDTEQPPSDPDAPPLVLDDTPLDPHAPVEPTETWITESFEDRPLVWYMPEHPRAVLWHFHGNDGTGSDARLIETVAILNELVDIDVGFVASTCQDGHQWDAQAPADDNEDLMRLERVRDHVMDQSQWTPDTPLFAWGFSSGTKMTAHFAAFALDQGWPIRALAVHNGDPEQAILPTLFIESANDDSTNPASIDETRKALEAAGIDTASYVAIERPLDPMRFLRIPAFTDEKSQFQFDELVSWDHVDPEGVRLTDVENINGVVAQMRTDSEGWDPVRAGEQLRVVWSTHRVDGQFALEERNFLASHLP